MRPKTSNQKEVWALSQGLPELTAEQMDEARNRDGRIYAGKSSCWCGICGHSWESSEAWDNKRLKKAVCPHCGGAFKIERKPQQKRADNTHYYTLLDVVGDWQVIRNWICHRSVYRENPREPFFAIKEVSQLWINAQGEKVAVATMVQPSYYHDDSWCWNVPLAVREVNDRHYYCGELGKGANKMLPIFRQRGLTKDAIRRTSYGYAFEGVLTDAKVEILARAGQYALLERYVDSYSGAHAIRELWPSVRVACRHKFIIKDAGTWLDYLMLLLKQGKDLHNPHYICNPDFLREHDRMVKKAAAKERAEERKRAREKAQAMAAKLNEKSPINKAYRKRIGEALLNTIVKSKNGAIVLQPLQSVTDFWKEYQALGHCVFSNEYYDGKRHPGALIIGAKVNGKRTETIELDTVRMKIVQCQGEHNHNSKHHDAILSLMKRNINKFKPTHAI